MSDLLGLAPFMLADKLQQLKSSVIDWVENVRLPQDAEEKMLVEDLKKTSVLDMPVVGGMPGVAAASVRRFARGIDPSLVSSLSETASQKQNMRSMFKAYLEKMHLLDPQMLDNNEEKLLDNLTDSLGPSGLRGMNNLIKALESGKIETTSKYPHIQFSGGKGEGSHYSWVMDRQTTGLSTKRSQIHIGTKGLDPRSKVTDPWRYYNAAPEEIAHATTSDALKYMAPRGGASAKLSQEKIESLLGSVATKDAITDVDRAVLERYLKDPKNLPWKPGHAGPGNPEPDPIEYLEAFIKPIYMPKRARTEIGIGKDPKAFGYDWLSKEAPVYWQMWEKEPEIFQKVHEMLEMPIPKSVRRKRQLGEFALTPEQKAAIQNALDMFKTDFQAAKDAYKRHTFGGTIPGAPPSP